MKTIAASLVLLLAMSGCVTREVSVAGVCSDGNGAPRKGIIVTGNEIRGSWLALFGPALPEIRPLASATSDDAGRFSLQLRSSRSMFLDVKDPFEKRALGGQARVSVPAEGTKLSLSVVVEDGYLAGKWEK